VADLRSLVLAAAYRTNRASDRRLRTARPPRPRRPHPRRDVWRRPVVDTVPARPTRHQPPFHACRRARRLPRAAVSPTIRRHRTPQAETLAAGHLAASRAACGSDSLPLKPDHLDIVDLDPLHIVDEMRTDPVAAKQRLSAAVATGTPARVRQQYVSARDEWGEPRRRTYGTTLTWT